MAKKLGLGRGLDSLIPDKKKEQTAKKTGSSKDDVKPAKKTSGKKTGSKKNRNVVIIRFLVGIHRPVKLFAMRFQKAFRLR